VYLPKVGLFGKIEFGFEGGEAHHGGLQATIFIEQFAARHARFRVRVHERDHVVNGGLFDEGIAVEQEHVAPLGNAHGLIIGFGEPGVVGVGDQSHVGEITLHHVLATVGGVVVHDQHFVTHLFDRFLHTVQAFCQQVFRVPIHDDD
jgi:hypothetical protein